MKKSTPKKTVKTVKKSAKKATRPLVKKPAVVSTKNSSTLSPFQILLWLSIIFSSILIIISKL